MIREGTEVKGNKRTYLVIYAKTWVWFKLASLKSAVARCGEVVQHQHPNKAHLVETNTLLYKTGECLFADSFLFMWCYGIVQKPHFSLDLYFVPRSCFSLPQADSSPQQTYKTSTPSCDMVPAVLSAIAKDYWKSQIFSEGQLQPNKKVEEM